MSLITINGTSTNVTATGEDVVQVVQNATDISQLHDVNTNGASEGDLLIYNSTSGNWEDSTTLTGTYTFQNTLTADGNIVPSGQNQELGSGSNRWDIWGDQILVNQIQNVGSAINIIDDIDLNDNALNNVNSINVTTAKIKKISPEQFENASTPRTRFYSDWSHPAHQAALGGNDISGEFLMGAADLSPLSSGLPFSAMGLTTPNGHDMLVYGAQGSADDGTHNTQMWIRGESNAIKSASEASLGTLKPLSIDSGDFTVNSTGFVTLNGEFVVQNANKSSFVVQPDYSTVSGDAVDFVRRNAEDGTNDSNIADGSEVKFNIYIQSADETSGQLIGGITGSTHSTDGNQFVFTLDNQAQTDQANSFTMTEEKVEIQQPLQFPSFSSTDRDAMSPTEGWVLFNSTTSKLQVYDGTSWVDLH